jgi:hypothetical protein
MSKNRSDYAKTDITVQPPPSYALHQHACLTLNRTDRIRLIRFPPAIIDVIRHAIQVSWRRGLQDEKSYAGAYEFKLASNPWMGQGCEAVESRFLMYVFYSIILIFR